MCASIVIIILHLLHIKRIEAISDEGTFTEFDKGMTSANPLDFPGYIEKIEKDQQRLD